MLVYWTKQGVEVWFNPRFDLVVAPHPLKRIFCHFSTNFSIIMHVWFASFHPQCTMLCSASYFWIFCLITHHKSHVHEMLSSYWSDREAGKKANICQFPLQTGLDSGSKSADDAYNHVVKQQTAGYLMTIVTLQADWSWPEHLHHQETNRALLEWQQTAVV